MVASLITSTSYKKNAAHTQAAFLFQLGDHPIRVVAVSDYFFDSCSHRKL